jgi:hypothetical protein
MRAVLAILLGANFASAVVNFIVGGPNIAVGIFNLVVVIFLAVLLTEDIVG